MKKHLGVLCLFTAGLLSISPTVFAQVTNTFPASGSVGIGTTSPSSILHVKPSGSGTILLGDISTGNTSLQMSISGSTGGYSQIQSIANSGSTWGSLALNASGGNVGIGTTAPGYNLDVRSSTSAAQVHVSGTGADNGLYLEDYGGDIGNVMLGMSFDGTNYIAKATSANQINFNGGVTYFANATGLTVGNTMSPSNIVSIGTNGIAVGTSYAGNTTPTNGAMIQGSVGIGTMSPSYTLHVNGSVAGTSAYNNLSDVRLKTDITPLSYGLNTVMKLHPVGFNWKNQDQEWKKQHQLGLIAQEVEALVPEVVTTADDEMRTKSLAYGSLVPVLIQAIQDQQQEISELKRTVGDLKVTVTTAAALHVAAARPR